MILVIYNNSNIEFKEIIIFRIKYNIIIYIICNIERYIYVIEIEL